MVILVLVVWEIGNEAERIKGEVEQIKGKAETIVRTSLLGRLMMTTWACSFRCETSASKRSCHANRPRHASFLERVLKFKIWSRSDSNCSLSPAKSHCISIPISRGRGTG